MNQHRAVYSAETRNLQFVINLNNVITTLR